MNLSPEIKVAPRFARSINLERDFSNPKSFDGYILTSTATNLFARIGVSLSDATLDRAWSISGSYGSGKSAFALFLAAALGRHDLPASIAARRLLKEQKLSTFQELFDKRRASSVPPKGYWPILVSGSAGPLTRAILDALVREAKAIRTGGAVPTVIKGIEKLAATRSGVNSGKVVENVLSLSQYLRRSGKSAGLLLVIDELGKFLEYAARDPEQGDVFILQQLAEAASDPTTGLVLVTVLHQAFENYAARLRPVVRAEWAKIQGRFTDVAFQDSAEELIKLISYAIVHSESKASVRLRRSAQESAERAADLHLLPSGMSRRDFVAAMRNCAPLHPLTVLALARLCRKFGQNQRSLFSFLTSREPHGFMTFLEADLSNRRSSFFLLHDLYDYVANAFGNGLLVGDGATSWVEVQTLLDRFANANPEQIQLIKTIGLLSVLGQYGDLKSSLPVLAYALEQSKPTTQRICESLVQSSGIVYRKHSQSYALWQGSDIDLEARLREAALHVAIDSDSLAQRLAGVWQPRPLVAKRHSLTTGTLRYFQPKFVDAGNFGLAIGEVDPDADGLILYAAIQRQAEREEMYKSATSALARGRREVLIAISEDTEPVADVLKDIELLKWVQLNTPDLKGDAVARREIQSRLRVLDERLEGEVQRLFSPQGSTSERTVWYHCGLPKVIESGRSLTQLLSDICDDVYSNAPLIRNELLNRRYLSSQAAAARRNLIEKMITCSDQENLGIVGTPPEFSMYISLLRSTGIHQREEEIWKFGAPSRRDVVPVWKKIEDFFSTCELKRRPVSELFGELQRMPFGLKMGLVPVLFCACAIAHDAEVALYENSAFVPEMSIEAFERLLRSPEKFELRSFKVEGVRRQVFSHFAALLPGAGEHLPVENLVSVVRPLYRFFTRLPEYAKKTNSLSEYARSLRSALLAAKDPDVLLFEAIPVSLSFPPFTPGSSDPSSVPAFFKRLKNTLSELQRSYDDLLSRLQQALFSGFSMEGPKAREALRYRAQSVLEHAIEPRLKAFVLHLVNDDLPEVAWMEAIGTLLVGKPPRTWADADCAKFEVLLTELVRNFLHREAITFEVSRTHSTHSPGEVFRIGVTDLHSKEMEAVVSVPVAETPQLAKAVMELESTLDALGLADKPKLSLAALAMVSRGLLAEFDAKQAERVVSANRGGQA